MNRSFSRMLVLALGTTLAFACSSESSSASIADGGTEPAADATADTNVPPIEGGSGDSGATASVFKDAIAVGTTSGRPLILDDDHVIFWNGHSVLRAPRNGATPAVTVGVLPNEFFPSTVVSDATHIYLIGKVEPALTTERVYALPRAGGPAVLLFEQPGVQPSTLLAIAIEDATHLVFSAGSIVRLLKTGGTPDSLGASAQTMLPLDGWLYFTTYDGGTKLFRRPLGAAAAIVPSKLADLSSEARMITATAKTLYVLTSGAGGVSPFARFDRTTNAPIQTPIEIELGLLTNGFGMMDDRSVVVSFANGKEELLFAPDDGRVLASDQTRSVREIASDAKGLCWINETRLECGVLGVP